MPHATTTTVTQPAQTLSLKPTAGVDDVVRPDIEWLPSYDTYQARVERLAALDLTRPSHVPKGWPTRIDAPRNWTGSEFTGDAVSKEYIVQLMEKDITEIEEALSYLKGRMHLLE